MKPKRIPRQSSASFMREKARTTPFDWPALNAALNTSNADASVGALNAWSGELSASLIAN